MVKRLSKKKINNFLNGAGLATTTGATGKNMKDAEEIMDKAFGRITGKYPEFSKEVTSATGTVQLLEPKYDQGSGNEDLTEITQETVVKTILDTLVHKADKLHVEYIGSKKNLIVSTAYHLEEHFKKTDRPQYICRISEIITHVLKTRVKRFVTDIYMRRTLDERFKNPQQRVNALQRIKSQTPGLPKDSGRTNEELLETLNKQHTVDEWFEILDSSLTTMRSVYTSLAEQAKNENCLNETFAKRLRKVIKEHQSVLSETLSKIIKSQ